MDAESSGRTSPATCARISKASLGFWISFDAIVLSTAGIDTLV